MKKMLMLVLCSASMFANELVIKGGGLVSHKLGNLDLIRTDNGYEVLKGTKRTQIKDYDVDALFKKLDKNKLAIFLKEGHGYPELTQLSNGDYRLKAHVRGNGGGPVLGNIVYWGVKSACYGVVAAGVSAGLIASGGVAGGALAAAVTVSAAPGAAVVAGAIGASAAASQTAMVATTAAIGAAGSAAGVAAAIETFALMCGVAAGAAPTL